MFDVLCHTDQGIVDADYGTRGQSLQEIHAQTVGMMDRKNGHKYRMLREFHIQAGGIFCQIPVTQHDTLIHQKYLSHLISELKPALTEIIQQGIERGEIHFERPAALAEIVLIVLSVKMDNTLTPSTPEEIEDTIWGLVSLLEKGTDNPPGSLNFLTT